MQNKDRTNVPSTGASVTTNVKQPPARRLGNFPLPNVPQTPPGRLSSIRTGPNLTLGGHQKKTFSPIVAPRKKKEKVPPPIKMPSILQNVTVTEDPKERLARTKKFPPRRPPPAVGFGAAPVTAAAPVISPFMQGPPEQRRQSMTIAGGAALRKGKVTTMEDIDPMNKYRPTALPFVNPVEKYEKEQLEAKKHKKKEEDDPLLSPQASVKMEIDEGKGKEKIQDDEKEEMHADEDDQAEARKKRQSAADFFMKDEMSDDNLFFIQLPSSLPTSLETEVPTKKEEGATSSTNISGLEETPFESRLGNIPDGYLGKLIIYKSGKVKMRLGDAAFDIIPGAECAFRQEAAVVSAEQKKCVVLGELSRRLICSADVQNLLQQTEKLVI